MTGNHQSSFFSKIVHIIDELLRWKLFRFRWVLTAAHCVSIDGRIDRIKEIEVFLGFSSYTNFAQNITVEPKDQHMHPGFLTTHFGFDIGIIMNKSNVQ